MNQKWKLKQHCMPMLVKKKKKQHMIAGSRFECGVMAILKIVKEADITVALLDCLSHSGTIFTVFNGKHNLEWFLLKETIWS